MYRLRSRFHRSTRTSIRTVRVPVRRRPGRITRVPVRIRIVKVVITVTKR